MILSLQSHYTITGKFPRLFNGTSPLKPIRPIHFLPPRRRLDSHNNNDDNDNDNDGGYQIKKKKDYFPFTWVDKSSLEETRQIPQFINIASLAWPIESSVPVPSFFILLLLLFLHNK